MIKGAGAEVRASKRDETSKATTSTSTTSTTCSSSSQSSRKQIASNLLLLVGLVAAVGLLNFGHNSKHVSLARRSSVSTTTSTTTTTTTIARNKDGCGLQEDGADGAAHQPHWVPYSTEDHATFQSVLQCLRESPLFPIHFRQSSEFQDTFDALASNLKKLHCEQLQPQLQPNLQLDPNQAETIRTRTRMMTPAAQTLLQYDRVAFIGDSVLIQQYQSLLCLVDPNVFATAENGIKQSPLEEEDEEEGLRYTIQNTTFHMERFGKQFWTDQQKNYSLFRNEAWHSYTQNDLIIVNPGIHYGDGLAEDLEEDIQDLQQVAQFIGRQARNTSATVLVVESNDQQFPTSNGQFVRSCLRQCQCEPMTPARLQGFEVPYDRGPYHVILNNTSDAASGSTSESEGDLHNHHHALPAILEPIYPNYQAPPPESVCIPNCLPPNWRNDLVRHELQKIADHHDIVVVETTATDAVVVGRTTGAHIVPIWRQLVAHGKDHSKGLGDCTHVTVEAAIAMNQQLIRTLIIQAPNHPNNSL